MKIKLEIKKEVGFQGGIFSRPIRYALPFYKSSAGKYVHRIRSSQSYYLKRTGERSHISVTFWCGNIGSLGKGKMYSKIDTNMILCAHCEGKAIGAGMDGAREINGRAVMYEPRK